MSFAAKRLYCTVLQTLHFFAFVVTLRFAKPISSSLTTFAKCFALNARLFPIIESPTPGMIVSNGITAWLARQRTSLVPITILLLLLWIAFRAPSHAPLVRRESSLKIGVRMRRRRRSQNAAFRAPSWRSPATTTIRCFQRNFL